MHRLILLTLTATTLLLVACGGGDGDPTPTSGGAGDGSGAPDRPSPTPPPDDGSGLDPDVTPPPGGIEGETVHLRIEVSGEGSVDYFLASNQMLVCPPDCDADFPVSFQARIQRERNLSDDEEGGFNLVGWGGDCTGLDALVEPRGGICVLDMDADKEVTVEFDPRARLSISFQGSTSTARYYLAYSPTDQKGGNPYAGAGQIDCSVPCPRDPHVTWYDIGTTITITLGDVTYSSFGGDCSGSPECILTMDGDKTVTVNWSQ